MELKSKSEKRLIVEAKIAGETVSLLVDTGASVGILDERKAKKLGVEKGRELSSTLVGAGGEMDAWHCREFAYIGEKPVPQFVIADIGNVVSSIKRETGIEIGGILSLPQMKMVGINIDANDNKIWIE